MMLARLGKYLLAFGGVLQIWLLLSVVNIASASEWNHYGGDAAGTRYSALTQINPDNVEDLEVAWSFRTGELERRGERSKKSSFQGTPILLPEKAGRSLVFCTPFNRIIALDPASGRERWHFEPNVAEQKAPYRCRGIDYWEDQDPDKHDQECAFRIFSVTNDRRLHALDSRTGKPCQGFGVNGEVVLPGKQAERFAGEIRSASPPAVINDTVVVGSTIQDFQRLGAPDGTVYAFDARTGERKWSFDPVPRDPEDPAYASWLNGSAAQGTQANVWAMMSADRERDLIFLPTSSPGINFYGGLRPGDNRYSDSVVALRGSTGEVVWHFQVTHHDIWDMDLAAQPVLAELEKDGKTTPVVIQGTKQGYLFVLHRETGEPYFPVEEAPVPQGGLLGEWLSPTQPKPSAPPPLVPQTFTKEDAWGFTFYDEGVCRDKVAAFRSEGLYTPISEQGTIVMPGTLGGINWGGVAFEPELGVAVTNTSRTPMVLKAIPRKKAEQLMQGKARSTDDHAGAGALSNILLPDGSPYGFQMQFLMSPFGAPCSEPPWGALTAVDMKTGEVKWDVTLGSVEKLAPLPVPLKLGTPNSGGPIVTGGGLVFIGATMDSAFRAFDIQTGEELWKTRLPAGGHATPMTYEIDGRQYVVIAAGGHDILGGDLSDHLIAYALPN